MPCLFQRPAAHLCSHPLPGCGTQQYLTSPQANERYNLHIKQYVSAFRRHPTLGSFTNAVFDSNKELFPWSPIVLMTTANTVTLPCLLVRETL